MLGGVVQHVEPDEPAEQVIEFHAAPLSDFVKLEPE